MFFSLVFHSSSLSVPLWLLWKAWGLEYDYLLPLRRIHLKRKETMLWIEQQRAKPHKCLRVCACEKDKGTTEVKKDIDQEQEQQGVDLSATERGVWRIKNIFEVKNITQEGGNTSSDRKEPWIFIRKLWARIYRSSVSLLVIQEGWER